MLNWKLLGFSMKVGRKGLIVQEEKEYASEAHLYRREIRIADLEKNPGYFL